MTQCDPQLPIPQPLNSIACLPRHAGYRVNSLAINPISATPDRWWTLSLSIFQAPPSVIIGLHITLSELSESEDPPDRSVRHSRNRKHKYRYSRSFDPDFQLPKHKTALSCSFESRLASTVAEIYSIRPHKADSAAQPKDCSACFVLIYDGYPVWNSVEQFVPFL